MAGDTTNRTTEMVSVQCFDVLDLEALDVELFETQEGERIVYGEAKCVCGQEIGSPSEGRWSRRVF